MDVAPGEIIHMDENGACKFPAGKLTDVHRNVKALLKQEEIKVNILEKVKPAEDIKKAFASHPYAK